MGIIAPCSVCQLRDPPVPAVHRIPIRPSPVEMHEAGYMGQERDCPGDRIRHIEREDGPVQLEDGAYPHDSQAACARKRTAERKDGRAAGSVL